MDVYDESAKPLLYTFLQDDGARARLLPEYEGLEPRQIYRMVQVLKLPLHPMGPGLEPCALLYDYRRPTLYGATVYHLPQDTTR